ncbi:cation transporter [bacterium]|nr:cation transporter [bacterium]
MEEHELSNENERKTLFVIVITIITMVAEIVFGYITNSMALLADGYHMGTHALALGLTYAAYVLARKFSKSELFPNGTKKIGTLAAYTSAIFLGLTGAWIIGEAIARFISPLNIQFNEAILVAIIGFVVNFACIVVMEHGHHDKEEKEDYNFKAAYYHILADALTSILAIIALVAGKYFNITSLDSIVGFVGGALIIRWAVSLVRNTVRELVDMKR